MALRDSSNLRLFHRANETGGSHVNIAVSLLFIALIMCRHSPR